MAQTVPADTLRQQLPEVVITPTLLETPATEVPRSVSVVTAQQVQLLQPLDLAQMLSLLPGVSVVGSGLNPGSNESVFLRGTNSNHSLLLVDGVRISDPSTPNGAVDFSEMPISSFGSLELLRGSHSTCFGNGAVGGLVSVSSPGWQRGGAQFGLAATTGTFGNNTLYLQQEADAGISLHNGFYGRLGFYNKMVDGLDATVDTITNPLAFKRFDNDDFSLQRGMLKVGYEKNKWKAHVFAALSDQQTDYDKKAFKYNNPFGENPLAWYDGDRTEIDFNRTTLGYSLQGAIGQHLQFRIFGGYSTHQRNLVDDSSIVRLPDITDHTYSASDYEGNTTNHDAHLIWKFSDALTLLAGIGYLREHMTFASTYFSNSFWGPYTFNVLLDTVPAASIAHAFAQAQFNGGSIIPALRPFHLVAGLRYSRHNQFGSHPDVLINPSWRFGRNLMLYASWSTGFQAPSLYQMYAPDTYYLSDVTRGNPDLKPEQSVAAELGARLLFGEKGLLELAYFRNRISNAIEYCYLWDENIPVDSLGTDWYRDDYRGDTYLNAGELTTQGVEVSLRLPLHRLLEVDANVTWLDGSLLYGPDLLQSEHAQGHQVQLFYSGAFPSLEENEAPLVRRSSTANVRLTLLPLSWIKFYTQGRYVGKRNDIFYDGSIRPFGAQNATELDSYLLWDAGLFVQPVRPLAVALRVENLFNTTYTEISGYASRPRGYFLSAYFQL